MIVKETKYLVFQIIKVNAKTREILVTNKKSYSPIGIIKWYYPWRQYILDPYSNTVWSKGCLQDVMNVMDLINQLSRKGLSDESME